MLLEGGGSLQMTLAILGGGGGEFLWPLWSRKGGKGKDRVRFRCGAVPAEGGGFRFKEEYGGTKRERVPDGSERREKFAERRGGGTENARSSPPSPIN